MPGYARELSVACRAARAAGLAIRRRYDEAATTARDKSDGSPVTDADLEANQILLEELRATFPDDAILSEEGGSSDDRLDKSRVWIIDPLDGTRDFVRRSGDFSVHVGLAIDGAAVVGAVYQPVTGRTFSAAAGGGAFCDDAPIAVSTADQLDDFRLATTRFAPATKLTSFIEDVWSPRVIERVGASVKMMSVASSELEVALWLTDREMEWDTCAPDVIIREAGGAITDLDGQPFRYNRPDPKHLRGVLVSNGRRHAELLELARPYLDS